MAKKRIIDPLEGFQVITLSDESTYIANTDTVGVEQTTILVGTAKANIINENTGEPGVVTGEELNAINRDDNSSAFDLYEKSDVYYYPECPGSEGGGGSKIVSYQVGNVKYDSLLPATATSITVTWEYTATTQNPDGTTTTTTGTASKTVTIPKNTGDNDKTISGTIKVDGTDVEIPYEVTQKGKDYQDITSYEVSNVDYDNPIPSSATGITVTWEYTMTYTDENGEEHTETGTDSRTVPIEPNTESDSRIIEGTIIVAGTEIPYSVTQEGTVPQDSYTVNKVEYPEEIPGNATSFTVTWTYTEVTYDEQGNRNVTKGTDSREIEIEPNTSGEEITITGEIEVEGTIIEYTVVQKVNYEIQYFTIVPLENEEIYLYKYKSNDRYAEQDRSTSPIFYSLDNGETWNSYSRETLDHIPVSKGQKVIWKSNVSEEEEKGFGLSFHATGKFNAEGNPMSLAFSDDFVNHLDGLNPRGQYEMFGTFEHLFDRSTIISAENLAMQSIICGFCYAWMFYKCYLLEKAPALPADHIDYGSYQHMFDGCYSLKECPEMNPTRGYRECFRFMFKDCVSLTKAPVLNNELGQRIYDYMFAGCSNLRYIHTTFEDEVTSVSGGTYRWVAGLPEEGVFVKNPNSDFGNFEYYGSSIPKGWTVIEDDGVTDYEKKYASLINHPVEPYVPTNPYEAEYFTVVARQETDVNVAKLNPSYTPIDGVSYSLDEGETWNDYNFGVTQIHLTPRQKVSFKSDITYHYGGSDYYNSGVSSLKEGLNVAIEVTGDIDVEGNIMSLMYGDNFVGKFSTLGNPGAFEYLLYNQPVVNANNLVLPAISLDICSYRGMFSACNKLVTIPEIPATMLDYDCYAYMFQGCTSLTEGPAVLPSEVAYGYKGMFLNCTSLTKAPELPIVEAKTMSCYQMFQGCTSLTEAPELPATKLGQNTAYGQMFMNCTNLVKAPSVLPADNIETTAYVSMFAGCTKLEVAPVIGIKHFPSHHENVFTNMFKGCSKLRYIKIELIDAPNEYPDMPRLADMYYWVYGVARTGTFVMSRNAQWNMIATNANNYQGIPEGWTIEYVDE